MKQTDSVPINSALSPKKVATLLPYTIKIAPKTLTPLRSSQNASAREKETLPKQPPFDSKLFDVEKEIKKALVVPLPVSTSFQKD